MDIASKAELMARLRDEGQWEDAASFREDCRLAARNEGLSRSEAKNRAWKEMEAAYPRLSHQQIDLLPAIRWFAMGEFPIEPLRSDEASGETGEVSLSSVWYGTCAAIALLHARSKSTPGWFQIAEQMVLRLQKEPRDEELRCVLAHALARPFEFLQGFALPRYEALLGSKEEKSKDDLHEISALAEVLAVLTPENLAEMLAGALS